MANINQTEKDLLEQYKNLYKTGSPSWSFHVAPAIPFIGDKMDDKKKRVLVYASAENLTYAFNLINS